MLKKALSTFLVFALIRPQALSASQSELQNKLIGRNWFICAGILAFIALGDFTEAYNKIDSAQVEERAGNSALTEDEKLTRFEIASDERGKARQYLGTAIFLTAGSALSFYIGYRWIWPPKDREATAKSGTMTITGVPTHVVIVVNGQEVENIGGKVVIGTRTTRPVEFEIKSNQQRVIGPVEVELAAFANFASMIGYNDFLEFLRNVKKLTS